MNSVPNRMVIYAKDVMNITGIQDARTARKFLDKIRKKFKKEKGSLISLDEFCEFTGFREERGLPLPGLTILASCLLASLPLAFLPSCLGYS